jgi:hypothetical protein
MADDTFLHRWSRRKHEAARSVTAPAQPQPATPAPAVAAPALAAAAPAPVEAQPLPPVESLSLASDFRPFLAEKVDEAVKRAALRKLFADPHFNAMDGLDIYIGDYSQPDPLPDGLLDKLADVYRSLDEKEAAGEAAPTDTVVAAVQAPEEPSPEPTDPVTDKGETTHERRG